MLIIFLILIANSCQKKNLRIRKLPTALPLPSSHYSTYAISLQTRTPVHMIKSHITDVTPIYALIPPGYHTMLPHIAPDYYDSFYNSTSMFDSDYTSNLFPTLISNDDHALSTTTQALSTTTSLSTTTTTDYLNNNVK